MEAGEKIVDNFPFFKQDFQKDIHTLMSRDSAWEEKRVSTYRLAFVWCNDISDQSGWILEAAKDKYRHEKNHAVLASILDVIKKVEKPADLQDAWKHPKVGVVDDETKHIFRKIKNRREPLKNKIWMANRAAEKGNAWMLERIAWHSSDHETFLAIASVFTNNAKGWECKKSENITMDWGHALMRDLALSKEINYNPDKRPILGASMPGGARFQGIIEKQNVQSGMCMSIRLKREIKRTPEDFGFTDDLDTEKVQEQKKTNKIKNFKSV